MSSVSLGLLEPIPILPLLATFKYPFCVFKPALPVEPAVYNTTSLPSVKFVSPVPRPTPWLVLPKLISPDPVPSLNSNCGFTESICKFARGLFVPIPTSPSLVIVNTSDVEFEAVNIFSVPFWAIAKVVPDPAFSISNCSVVKTSLIKVVFVPKTVRLDAIKSPFISTSPVYKFKSTDITPLLSINVFRPFLTPPKVVSLAGFKFIILLLSMENSSRSKYLKILLPSSTSSILVFNSLLIRST